ncbi:MAG TPA: ATP-binding protein [Stellaceae bacterium]|jgi:two-component system osmolarity sensor histidine kinase EnvZ|nr:ATP-binding protein [Stellaceae bacterium]
MSSSPIERPAPPRDLIRPRRRLPWRGWRWQIKDLLPRTLFGRAVLILVTPLVLVQIVTTWIFYDRLWDTVTHRLATGVVGDIALVIDTRPPASEPAALSRFLVRASSTTGLRFDFDPAAHGLSHETQEHQRDLLSTNRLIEPQLTSVLEETIHHPLRLTTLDNGKEFLVAVSLHDGVLKTVISRDRLWTSTTYILLLWMFGTALITFTVATIFMRNQIRSLRRLASAAEAFGKGRDVGNFRLEGAAEVRQAAAAFQNMRDRIQRFISQRTEMLAGVSHDLRTPLTRMKLELELLGDGEDIQGLKSDVAEMERMIAGYLDFMRGEGAEQVAAVDIMEVVQLVVANAQRAGTEITLTGAATEHLPLRRDAIQRVLANLVGNAGRYGSHVWVTVLPGRSGVEVWVEDDGPGIPEELREAVFQPFFRVDASRNVETGGTGLGLTIARSIARGHGGDLTLDTSPQGGLRARLYLPR